MSQINSVAGASAVLTEPGSETAEVQGLLTSVQNSDPATRMAAAHEAGPLGAMAVAPLGALLGGDDPGVAKAADEALKRITHHAARPGARIDAEAVSGELIRLLSPDHPKKVRLEAIRLIQFVGDDRAVGPLAELLKDPDYREEARLSLERIPGRAATRALEQALRTAPEEFRPNLQQSLAARRRSIRTLGTENHLGR